MPELPRLNDLAKGLLEEKKYPIELYGPSVNKHHDEPVGYLPARDGEILAGLSWYHGLSIDLKKAGLQLKADYNCSEVGLYSGWFRAMDTCIREQLFQDTIFYLMPGSSSNEGFSVIVEPDRSIAGLCSTGSMGVPHTQLFPENTPEHKKIVAAKDYWWTVQQRERQMKIDLPKIEDVTASFEEALAS